MLVINQFKKKCMCWRKNVDILLKRFFFLRILNSAILFRICDLVVKLNFKFEKFACCHHVTAIRNFNRDGWALGRSSKSDKDRTFKGDYNPCTSGRRGHWSGQPSTEIVLHSTVQYLVKFQTSEFKFQLFTRRKGTLTTDHINLYFF